MPKRTYAEFYFRIYLHQGIVQGGDKVVGYFPFSTLFQSFGIKMPAIFGKAFLIPKFLSIYRIGIKIVIQENGVYIIIGCYFCNYFPPNVR